VLSQVLLYPEATVFLHYHRRRMYLRDQSGQYPRGTAHPDEGRESASDDHATIGLFYGFGMPETGWGSDGEF
jgi:hypothetical protein